MILLEHNISLKSLNTFAIDVNAENLIAIYHEAGLFEVIAKKLCPIRILGGGSNILSTGDLVGYTLKNEIKGIEIIDEDENQIMIKVGAGEKWHQFVMWSISHNLGGIENLSLIPGSVGAAPMQNIGAYGVEQESVFHSLNAVHMANGEKKLFFKDECNFGYRESIFKKELKDQYFITHVNYILRKKDHSLQLDYGAIRDTILKNGIESPDVQNISDAVIEIRKSKLPDPNLIGNAGSFFKNPVIQETLYHSLKNIHPEIPCYPISETTVKVPAGWLIEKSGFKGKTFNKIGVHKDQALVLVNYGGGCGKDILDLAFEIKKVVKDKFKIDIEPEVNIW